MFGTIGADDKPAMGAIDRVVGHARQANNVLSNGLNSMGSWFTGVGDKLTSSITKPAIGATTALTGITLVKGFNRLVGIDEAKAKLLGLGHNAEGVEKIMVSALESVKGTSFGMDEAATTAANAVAAGIEPGKELTKYLSLTGDAAAIAGVSLAEMGSIVNKVTTGGRAMTENLEQLSDRGLPIYQWLAKEANVAADEVKGLASSGKISSEMFMAAIEKNIGGAASIIGDNSFKASLDNMWASVGRIGANFLDAGGKGGGFFSTLKPLIGEFTESLGKIEAKASELGVKFGEAFSGVIDYVLELKAKFDSLSPSMQQATLKAVGMGTAVAVGIGPALQIFGKFTSALSPVAKAFETLNSGIDLIPIKATKASGAFGQITNGLMSVGTMALKVLGPGAIIATIIAGLGLVQGKFGEQLDGFFQIAVQKGPQIIEGLVQGIISKIPTLIAQGTTLITNFLTALTANLPAIIQGGADIITTLVEGLASNVGNIIPVVVELLQTFIQNIIIAAPSLLEAGLTLLMALIDGIVENLPAIIDAVIQLTTLLISQIAASLPMLIEAGIKILVALVEGITTAIPLLIEAIPVIWQALKNGLASVDWPALGKAVLDGIGQGLSAIGSMFAKIFEPLTNWANKKGKEISDSFKKAGDSAKTSWAGTKEYFKGVGDSIKDGFDATITWFEGLPAWFSAKWEQIKEAFFTGVSFVKELIDENFGWIYPYIEGVFNGVTEYLSGIWEVIKNIFIGPLLLILDLFTGNFDEMQSHATQIMQNIADGFSQAWEGIKEVFSNSVGAVLLAVIEGFTNMKDKATQKMTEIGQAIQKGWNDSLAWMQALPGRLMTSAMTAFESAKTAVTTKMTEVYNTVVEKWNAALTWMAGLPGRISTAVTNAWQKAVTAVTTKMTEVKEAVSTKWTEATNFLSSIDLMEIGRNVIEGFLSGINEKWENVKQTLSDMADSVKGFFTNALDIHSPSRVMKAIGLFTGDGLIEGLEGSESSIQRAMMGIADIVSGTDLNMADISMGHLGVANGYGYNNQAQDSINQEIISMLSNMIDLLYALLEKDSNLYMDGQLVTDILKQKISQALREMSDRNSQNQGIVPKPI